MIVVWKSTNPFNKKNTIEAESKVFNLKQQNLQMGKYSWPKGFLSFFIEKGIPEN